MNVSNNKCGAANDKFLILIQISTCLSNLQQLRMFIQTKGQVDERFEMFIPGTKSR